MKIRRESMKDELLRIVFVLEHGKVIIFVVLIVNVEQFDREEVEYVMFVHHDVISLVDHL